MTMVPRNDVNQSLIDAAKKMPGAHADDDDDKRQPDSQAVKDAEAPVGGIPGAPGRLPGYGK